MGLYPPSAFLKSRGSDYLEVVFSCFPQWEVWGSQGAFSMRPDEDTTPNAYLEQFVDVHGSYRAKVPLLVCFEQRSPQVVKLPGS